MAKSNAVLDDLKALSDDWDSVETAEGFFTLPEGSFDARISDCEIGYSKAGNLQITYELTLLNGEYKNKKVKKFASLDNADRLGYTKADLKRLGLEIPADIQDLPELLDTEVIGIELVIDVKETTKGDVTYSNIYFDKVLASSEEADPPEEKTTAKRRTSQKEEETEPEKPKTLKGQTVSYKDGRKKVIGECVKDLKTSTTVEIMVNGEIWDVERGDVTVEEPAGDPEEAPRRRKRK